MLKLMVAVLACAIVAMAAGPIETLERVGMNARRAYLEDEILTRLASLEPEELLGYVVELKESIYEQIPLAPTADQSDRWIRELVNVLHEIGKIDSKKCFDLDHYSTKVNQLIEDNKHEKNLVNFAKFYHQKQLAMCS